MNSEHFKFRPSARLISTIGQDIIKDMHAAIVELVKNAYDADANTVKVIFDFYTTEDCKKIIIQVIDDGHGMKKSTVESRWLVPSTNDKLLRKYSPKGRVMQGRKGIGRFATAVLGEELELVTVADNEKTYLKLNWADFDEDKFLDEIEINLKSEYFDGDNGSIFRIIGYEDNLEQWNEKEIDFLIKELRKLLTPLNKKVQKANRESDDQEFDIFVEFGECHIPKYCNKKINITPFPLSDYFDYRLYGLVGSDGKGILKYQNSAIGNEIIEEIELIVELNSNQRFCGEVFLDLRVFDRDPEAINKLVENNYLTDAESEKLGKNEARRLLDQISGVNIYRNRFRIRPYGDPGYDWLDLDKKRVQDPSYRIGSNQVSGYVEIQNEEYSNLTEKSARDGLKEDAYYFGLQEVVKQALLKMENSRYSFRKKTGKGRKAFFLDAQFEKLVDHTTVKTGIVDILIESKIEEKKINEVEKLIDKNTDEKRTVALEIQKAIAVYEGHATLGKIMNVIMHEARKPLAWFRNQSETINKTFIRYSETKDPNALEKMIRILGESVNETNILIRLFDRLSPLAVKKRGSITEFFILKVIEESLRVFEGLIKANDINVVINCPTDIQYKGWKEDIYIALTNIIENSIYWVSKIEYEREIAVNVSNDDNVISIEITDNGPGVVKDMLLSGAIFEPGISAKPNQEGTGLGLAIAGEAIARNKGEIKAVEVQTGACFVIELPLGGNLND